MNIPYRFRFLNWLYAKTHHCFWLPCPICGRNFGGHEWSGTLSTSPYTGVGVCPMCKDAAERRTMERWKRWQEEGAT